MKKDSLFFFDLDGTLFDPDIRMLWAFFFNRLTFRLIRKNGGKTAVITGRARWDFITKSHCFLVGAANPDVSAVGAGTMIYWRTEKGSYEKDRVWNGHLKNSIVEWNNKEKSVFTWDKHEIAHRLGPFLKKNHLHILPFPNSYVILIPLYNTPITRVYNDLNLINCQWKGGVKAILTEQLTFPNTETVFSGYIMVLPERAGKENAARYIIKKLNSHGLKKHLFFFGDASIDVAMLTMKTGSENTAHRFATHPTPNARRMLLLADSGTVKILEGSAPRQILKVVKRFIKEKNRGRNSPYRILIKPFEAIVDRVVYPKLTPDELSFRGLFFVEKGLLHIHSENSSLIKKLKGFLIVSWGVFLDLVDGIRSRSRPHLRSGIGQLVDVYCDRMKEVKQLENRGQYDAAISCLLPSIARAEAEMYGAVVSEYDPNKGSMLSRTKKLLVSLLCFVCGMEEMSKKIDGEIFKTNLATYLNRKAIFPAQKAVKNKRSQDRFYFLIGLLKDFMKEKSYRKNEINQSFHKLLSRYIETTVPDEIEKLHSSFRALPAE